jgi:hypothetical protein
MQEHERVDIFLLQSLRFVNKIIHYCEKKKNKAVYYSHHVYMTSAFTNLIPILFQGPQRAADHFALPDRTGQLVSAKNKSGHNP